MILRDPVHGLVSFESAEQQIIQALLEAREVQRLRRVRQLGLTSLAYPGADHTRFSHALGTAHVMSRYIDRIRAVSQNLPFWQRLTTERARDALAAALLHDVGHGPFSHLFEAAMPRGPRHEDWSERIVLDEVTEVHQVLRNVDPQMPARVASLIRGRHELPYLAHAVSGTFDVDRCDYLLRDAHFTGVNYGRFDLDWLLRSFTLAPHQGASSAPTLAIDGTKGLPAIESFTLARLFMFQQVYFHKAGRTSEWLLARILDRVRSLLIDGTRLAHVPRAVAHLAREDDSPLGDYLALDDSIMWTALSGFTNEKDSVLADLSNRLLRRKLFKAYELFGQDATSEGKKRCLDVASELAQAAGFDPEIYVGLDTPSALAFDDTNDPITVVFPDGGELRPAEVSFLLGRLKGQTLARPRVIYPPEIRPQLLSALGKEASAHNSSTTLAGGSISHE